MQLAVKLVGDVNEDLQRLLVQQGLLGVCCTILLRQVACVEAPLTSQPMLT